MRSNAPPGALKLSQNGHRAVKLNPFIIAAAVAASLTACSILPHSSSAGNASPAANGNSAVSQAANGTPSPDAGNLSSGDCLLGANNADVEVGIGNPTVPCGGWIRNLAGTGLVWYPISQMVLPGSAGTADSEAMQQACDLTDGTEELYVEDAGSQMYGDSICSQEEQNGWTPENSPGPFAAQAQQQAQQQAQAQASTSAAASQASANADAEQQAQSDLSTLQGFSPSSDLSQLSNDVTQTSKDLASEKTAAAAGPNADGGNCYNLTANVDYDAESNVSYDAQSNFGYDLQQNLTPDISSGRKNISTLQSDLSNLQSLGLPAPSGAQAAVTVAENAIRQAISTANVEINQENGYVSQAYSVANSIATGSCVGDGPGSAPSPIQLIS